MDLCFPQYVHWTSRFKNEWWILKCLNFLLLHNKSPQTRQLKISFHYFVVLWIRSPGSTDISGQHLVRLKSRSGHWTMSFIQPQPKRERTYMHVYVCICMYCKNSFPGEKWKKKKKSTLSLSSPNQKTKGSTGFTLGNKWIYWAQLQSSEGLVAGL